MNVSASFQCLERVDPSLTMNIVDTRVNEFTVDITVKNAAKLQKLEDALKKYFGGMEIRVREIENTQDLLVSVSRMLLPGEGYPLSQILSYLEQNRRKGWFFGMGRHEPTFLDLDRLIHACVYGSSGYGKSNFFRFLLAQTLANQEDTINHIVDPKKVTSNRSNSSQSCAC